MEISRQQLTLHAGTTITTDRKYGTVAGEHGGWVFFWEDELEYTIETLKPYNRGGGLDEFDVILFLRDALKYCFDAKQTPQEA